MIFSIQSKLLGVPKDKTIRQINEDKLEDKNRSTADPDIENSRQGL